MLQDKNHKKKPFKLDELPKSNVFTTPDRYFEELPTIVQTKAAASTKRSGALSLSPLFYRLTAASLIVLVVAIGYFNISNTNTSTDIAGLIDEVSTEELVAYLDDSDLSTDEFLAMVNIEELYQDYEDDPSIQLFEDEEIDELMDELENFTIEEILNDI